jgi:UDP-N-acetylglucosamine--dolichyl-phosphate N-acetylglucosaminephosphotransferase
MEIMLFLSILVSLVLAAAVLPKWIKKCHQVGLLWEDMNKYGHPRNVAASGGIVVVFSFVLGVLSYIAIRTFLIGALNKISPEIFAILVTILMFSLIGLVDDLFGWKSGGISKRFRIFFAVIAAIPLMVINAGVSVVNLPFVGVIGLGIFYPLVLVPLGIAGAAISYNFLAGFNGLEAGQGIIILSFLSFISFLTGNSWLSIIGLIMVASLIAFYYYNRSPARVFPGDSLTWSIGALIATMAILGNFEKIALFVFIPYILEAILKIRGGLNKHSFGIPEKDGSLKLPYKKIYGVTHLSIFLLSKFKRKVREKEVTYLIFAIQILICLLALIIFREALFL